MKAKATTNAIAKATTMTNAKARDSKRDSTCRICGVHLGFVGEVSEIAGLRGEGQGMSLDT